MDQLTDSDKKVINAFTDGKPATSRLLDTDGKRLDGMWMGGDDLAHWIGDKIQTGPGRPHVKSDEIVLRYLKKITPKNWMQESVQIGPYAIFESITPTTGPEYGKTIEDLFRKYFKRSYCHAYFSTNLGAALTVQIALGKDKNEWSNGIWHNDPMWTVLHIRGFGKDGTIGPRIELDFSGGSILINSTDPARAFSKVRALTKMTGTPDQVLKKLDAGFAKLKKVLIDNLDNLPSSVVQHYDPKTKL